MSHGFLKRWFNCLNSSISWQHFYDKKIPFARVFLPFSLSSLFFCYFFLLAQGCSLKKISWWSYFLCFLIVQEGILIWSTVYISILVSDLKAYTIKSNEGIHLNSSSCKQNWTKSHPTTQMEQYNSSKKFSKAEKATCKNILLMLSTYIFILSAFS